MHGDKNNVQIDGMRLDIRTAQTNEKRANGNGFVLFCLPNKMPD